MLPTVEVEHTPLQGFLTLATPSVKGIGLESVCSHISLRASRKFLRASHNTFLKDLIYLLDDEYTDYSVQGYSIRLTVSWRYRNPGGFSFILRVSDCNCPSLRMVKTPRSMCVPGIQCGMPLNDSTRLFPDFLGV